MFLFFFLSGYLYQSPKDKKRYIREKGKTLLVPFWFWNIFSSILDYVVNRNLKDVVERMFMIDGKICNLDAPIWFLHSLFLTEILYMLIESLGDKRLLIIAMGLALILGGVASESHLFLKIGILPISYFYYALGAKLPSIQAEILDKRKNRYMEILFLIVVNVLFGVLWNERISVINCYYGNYIFSVIAGISGVLLYCVLAKQLKNEKVIKVFGYWGRNTMLIMCTQYFCFRFYDKLSEHLWGFEIWNMRNTGKAFLIAVMTITIICTVSEFIRKSNLKMIKLFCGIR